MDVFKLHISMDVFLVPSYVLPECNQKIPHYFLL